MYCPSCGIQNDDDSLFCKKCGHDLRAGTGGPGPQRARDREDDCERDCKGSDRDQSFFWGVIIIIVGAWVVWEFGLKQIIDAPDWVEENDVFCTIIWVVIGIAILLAGLRMISRRSQRY